MDSADHVGGTFAEGGEVMGLRGFRGLRQALGVTGVRCLDRLLQIRIKDAMRQLSAVLVLAKHGAQTSSLICAAFQHAHMCTHTHAHTNPYAMHIQSSFMPCCVQITITRHRKCICFVAFSLRQRSLLYADVDLSMLDASKSSRSSHVMAPDPAAFKEAVKSGGKLWPIMSHYLAALGQASLVRQQLASDLKISER